MHEDFQEVSKSVLGYALMVKDITNAHYSLNAQSYGSHVCSSCVHRTVLNSIFKSKSEKNRIIFFSSQETYFCTISLIV